MASFEDKISISDFSIEDIDTSEIDKLSDWLPSNGVMDLNIAEQGLIVTLNAQNICQEKITQVDRLIGLKENEKNIAWSNAALVKAHVAGHKTVKSKEWFAQADEDYIKVCNELVVAKACKKWFENKAGYFSGWHYAFKTFLRRDYGLEKLGNFQSITYNNRNPEEHTSGEKNENADDMCGEIDWKQ
jgi:hypothetical protein